MRDIGDLAFAMQLFRERGRWCQYERSELVDVADERVAAVGDVDGARCLAIENIMLIAARNRVGTLVVFCVFGLSSLRDDISGRSLFAAKV